MVARIVLIFIALYRKINYNKPLACRFVPTCSEYMEHAVIKYGISGVFVGITRILRCNQFFKGGYDPII